MKPIRDASAPRAPMLPPLLVGLLFAAASCSEQRPGSAAVPVAQGANHEGQVRLGPDQIAAAGIETVVAAAGTIEETLHLVARVSSNEDTIVHVTPRIDGIVQAIHKGLGDYVKAGEPLAEVWSVELGNIISSYLQARATTIAAEETLAQTRALYEDRLTTVTQVLDGEIAVARKIFEREEGLQEKGIATIRPYLEADKQLQKALLAKDRELSTLGAERDTEVLQLEVAHRLAVIDEVAAKDRLLVLGFDQEQIAQFPDTPSGNARMILRAPRDGVILEREITLNEHVSTSTVMYMIHDLSTVWVLASAYEQDMARLRLGQKAYIHLQALPGTTLESEIAFIDFQVSATTRSTSVRIELPNNPVEGWPIEFPLRPGMFGEVEVVVDSRPGRVVLPELAIVHEGGEDYVFVADPDDPSCFVREQVTVREGAHDRVEIVNGVDPGQRVVVAGTFALKSMARSAELGEGH